jgi:hypothetical protein
MSIPADHWHDNGDGTAWWVWRANEAFDGETGEDYIHPLDRPCDSPDCRGGEIQYPEWEGETQPCPDCDGTRRHTFGVAVEGFQCELFRDDGLVVTHRVSVVPGMVLPIVEYVTQMNPEVRKLGVSIDGAIQQGITLPPAAKPGLWAVKLAVHS